jgi:hypothetical protein
MLLRKIFLRERFSFSFFTQTLLIALTAQSSLAFSIGPINVTPTDMEQSYTLPDQREGIAKWDALNLQILTRGGTTGLLQLLGQDFQNWTFNSAANDLAGSFAIEKYVAIGTPNEVGAELRLRYNPGTGDPNPLNNSLHWIQRVTDNHNVTTNIHGDNENLIDIGGGVTTPFYDTPTQAEIDAGIILDEGFFKDLTLRPDSDKNHNWLAELYLVDLTGSNQVTIYNGIQWGWNNHVQSVPEPLTILAAGISLGFGVLFKKTSLRK